MSNASAEFFGKLAYASFLLGPDAPKPTRPWHKLREDQREWFRQSASHYINEIEKAEPKTCTSQASKD